MTFNLKSSVFAVTACLAALASAPAATVHADSAVSCSSLLAGAVDASDSSQLGVIKVEQLYHYQARPWARVPDGVALHVKAPRGTTAADLHNLAAGCAREGADPRSPLCVKGASISVSRAGGVYIVRITSDSRAEAIEIQKRAAQL